MIEKINNLWQQNEPLVYDDFVEDRSVKRQIIGFGGRSFEVVLIWRAEGAVLGTKVGDNGEIESGILDVGRNFLDGVKEFAE